MKKKKNTFKDKIKGLWSKVRKPMIISSFILNGLFVLVAIIGCSSSKPVENGENSSLVQRNNLVSSSQFEYYEFNADNPPLTNYNTGESIFNIYSYSVNYTSLVWGDTSIGVYKVNVERDLHINAVNGDYLTLRFYQGADDEAPKYFRWWYSTQWNFTTSLSVNGKIAFYNLNQGDNRYKLFSTHFKNLSENVPYFNLSSNFNPIDLLGNTRYFASLQDCTFPLVENINIWFGDTWYDSLWCLYGGYNIPGVTQGPSLWYGNGNVGRNDSGSATFVSLQARNTVTGNTKIIYTRDYYTYFGLEDYPEGLPLIDMTKEPHWLFYNYSNVYVVNGLYKSLLSNYNGYSTLYDLLNSQSYYYSTPTGDIQNATNPFGLLSSAFSSVTSIFGMALLPGITIGTLVFIPLVVAIILAVVKLIKKG